MRKFSLTAILVVFVTAASPALAQKQRTTPDATDNLDALIARHAAANNIPEALLRRVIKRESGGNPRAVSKGNFGLAPIKLATARGLGYRGVLDESIPAVRLLLAFGVAGHRDSMCIRGKSR